MKRFNFLRIAACLTALHVCLASLLLSQTWVDLQDGSTNLTQVAFVRDSSETLHLVTRRDTTVSSEYRYHTISASGMLSDSTPLLSNWTSLTYPGIVVLNSGQLAVHFSGLRTTDVTDIYARGILYRLTSDVSKSNWTLDPVVYLDSSLAYGSNQNSVISASGTELVAIPGSAGTSSPVGFDYTTAAKATTQEQSCCTYDANIVTDEATGDSVVAWFSNATNLHGRYFQTLFPTTSDRYYAPGSANDERTSSISSDGRVPLVARRGGGVYSAYCAGYIPCTALRVWRYKSDSYVDIPNTENVTRVMLAKGAAGRLWAMWTKSNKVYVAISDSDVTRFSSPFEVVLPQADSQVYRLSGEGSTGPLDLFATISKAGGGTSSHYRRVGIPLSVSARIRKTLAGGTIKVKVTDLGTPVSGAITTIGAFTKTTNSRGVAVVKVKKVKRYSGSVSADGYTGVSFKVRP